jgi:phosphotriesterase-related protein
MSDGTVMTVRGPLPASELGPTDAHEHLFLETPAQPGESLADPKRAIAEVREARAAGLGALVELTPIGLGRRPDLLRVVSEATGVAIVGATGYHRDSHYPPGHWVHAASVEALAKRIVADLLKGMHPADLLEGMHPADRLEPVAGADPALGSGNDGSADPDRGRPRAGVIKAGASHGHITPGEERRLRAAAAGSRVTGAPIVVHTEAGTCGPEIVRSLVGEGVAADRITLAHMDRAPDPGLHGDLAARGVTLLYDTVGKAKYGSDEERLGLIEAMVAAGHVGRLLVGLDMGRPGYFRSYGGGPGMRHLMAGFAPRLRERLGDEPADAILVANPARVFAIAPVPQLAAR